MHPISRRRFFDLTAKATLGLGAARVLGPFNALAAETAPGIREIDAFVNRHIREMGVPGLTLGLADRNGVIAVRTYGHTDVKTGRPVAPDDLFEIGSITKSFTALSLLQLREQGKLDLNRPIREYLPWLRIESAYAPITAHHLLTHTSGLPNPLSLPSTVLWTAHAPGEHFHYCNLGYEILGLLLISLDGRPLRDIFRARIFEPLGMTASEGVISHDIRERLALSYWPVYDDRPFQRHGSITEAPNIAMDNAAGCIASTPRDMALYMKMLLNQGRPLISKESFALFTKPAIPAPGFGKDAGYGYGIAIQPVEGRTILRHTGGMVSFSSAMHVDLDSGFGAFASVNASLAGYRPNAVAGYALTALRTVPIPPAPEFDDPYKVPNAADYVGTYTAPDGKQLEIAIAGKPGDRLELVHKGERLALERIAPDNFWAPDPAFALYPLTFERDGDKVVEVSHGGDWYAGERYKGPRTFEAPPEYRAYAGHYRNEDPWMGSARVILRKGRLWLGGAPLMPLGGGLFRIGEEEHEPDRVLFQEVVNGRALRAVFSGTEFRRVET
ncbi:MAG TPA: serine hydrolase domain-containing protein [Thermoanaerobaculia bacterium]|jgi:CubicO group peptidase (beta-lactamase class C family)|nr:serine hydrolase domain-containing protein [Thermoanaerobaculia bacterium]